MMTIILSTLLAFFLSGCSAINQNILNNKDSGNILSSIKQKVEEKIFTKKDDPLDIYAKGSLRDKDAVEYANSIWRKLALDQYDGHQKNVYLLQTARIQAATDLAVGMINVTRGMLNMIDNEAELACLIGHEMGHRLGKSWEKKNDHFKGKVLSKTLDQLAVDPGIKNEVLKQQREINAHGWSKEIEAEADRIGADLAAKAGYDTYAFCDLFERLSKKVNADVLYRIRKLKGSHPALDERAAGLKKYLISKGHALGQGMRNAENYHNKMRALLAVRTQESKQEQLSYPVESADLTRLQEIQKEIKEQTLWGQHLTVDRFVALMSEVARITRRSGISKEDLFAFQDAADAHFMEEEIYQDRPVWARRDDYIQEIKEHIREILSYTAQIGIGSIPVVGNVISFYEVWTGKNFFNGAELTAGEKALSCIGVFIGSGKAWKAVAEGIKKEVGLRVLNRTAGSIEGIERSVQRASTEFEEGVDHQIKLRKAEDVNKELRKKSVDPDDYQDSYPIGGTVVEYALAKDTQFVRVHVKGRDVGYWVMKKEDVLNLTPAQIKEKFVLKDKPTHISDVVIPKGTKMRVGF